MKPIHTIIFVLCSLFTGTKSNGQAFNSGADDFLMKEIQINWTIGVPVHHLIFNSKDEEQEVHNKGQISHFSIYPNPTSQKLFVETDKSLTDLSVNIYNTAGTKVLSKDKIASAFTIDLTGLLDGIYMIQLYDRQSNTISTSKFLKIN